MENLIIDLGRSLSRQIGDVSHEVKSVSGTLVDIQEQIQLKEQAIEDIRQTTQKIENRIECVEDKLEKQDILLRRDNVILHGIPEPLNFETEEDLVFTFVCLLNKYELDISSAYRLGKRDDSKTRPVLVRLVRNRDKKALVSSKQLRDALRKRSVRLDDDLTANQKKTLNELRDEGFIAYFRGTRLYTRRRGESASPERIVVGNSGGGGGGSNTGVGNNYNTGVGNNYNTGLGNNYNTGVGNAGVGMRDGSAGLGIGAARGIAGAGVRGSNSSGNNSSGYNSSGNNSSGNNSGNNSSSNNNWRGQRWRRHAKR